jgi:hypothetical protein
VQDFVGSGRCRRGAGDGEAGGENAKYFHAAEHKPERGDTPAYNFFT